MVLVCIFWIDKTVECATVGELKEIGDKSITITQLPQHNHDNHDSLNVTIPINAILKVEILEPEPKRYTDFWS